MDATNAGLAVGPIHAAAARPGVLFLNRSYWPDAEATGQLLTQLCEDLIPQFAPVVIAGQPNQNPGGQTYRSAGTERHRGVVIQRVRHCRFPKRFLPGRLCNLVSYFLGAAWVACRQPRPAVVVVETDPPLLALLGYLLKRWHRVPLLAYLHDIHPDMGVALGKVREGLAVRCVRGLLRAVYRRADAVVVLSDDMKETLIRWQVAPEKLVVVPNWIDTTEIVPSKQDNPLRQTMGWGDEFVVMYSGNLGLCQRLEEVLEAATLLRQRADVRFVFVGDGVSRAALQKTVQERGLAHVQFLDYQPRTTLAASLSAADLHLIPVDERVIAYMMPSKLYGVLASGTASLVLAPAGCELLRLVEEAKVGLTVATTPAPEKPGKKGDAGGSLARAMADAIVWGTTHREELAAMGRRARQLAVESYDRRLGTARFAQVLAKAVGRGALDKLPYPQGPLSAAVAGTTALANASSVDNGPAQEVSCR